jgi:hypothetical protein
MYERNGNKWSSGELNNLYNEYELQHLNINQIAILHKRSGGAIFYKLLKEKILQEDEGEVYNEEEEEEEVEVEDYENLWYEESDEEEEDEEEESELDESELDESEDSFNYSQKIYNIYNYIYNFLTILKINFIDITNELHIFLDNYGGIHDQD